MLPLRKGMLWITFSFPRKQFLSSSQITVLVIFCFTFGFIQLRATYYPACLDDPSGFEACGFVELDQQLSNHVGKILDYLLTIEELLGDLLAGGLHANGGTVPAGVAIHTANHSRNGWLLPIACWGVCAVSVLEDGTFLRICPFLPDYLFYCHIVVHNSLL